MPTTRLDRTVANQGNTIAVGRDLMRRITRSSLTLSVVIAAMLVLITALTALAATPIFVRPGGDDTNCDGTIDVDYPGAGTGLSCAVMTIQQGVDLVDAGGTVNVAAGTYDEQVVIDSKSLTLQGAGVTTIIRPSSAAVLTSVYTTGTQSGAFFNGDTIASIIDVRNVGTAGVTVRDLTVDGEDVVTQPAGATRFSGITYGETGGLIDTVRVEDTGNIVPATVRSYSVWLDAVANTAVSVDVVDSTAFHYGRNGLNARGDDLSVDFTDNIITGPGTAADQVPNGVLLISGAGGTVTGNTITANHYASTPTFFGSGVLLFQAGDGVDVSENDISDVDDAVLINATDLTTVEDNDLSGNVKGVRIEAGDAANNTITGNTISGNSLFGIELSDTVGAGNAANDNSITGNGAGPGGDDGVVNNDTQLFDASDNWWGTNTAAGVAAEVSANVDYTPWLDAGADVGGDPADGFQGDFSFLHVDDDSAQVGATTRIQEGVNLVTVGGTVDVKAGTYDENVSLTQRLTLQGAGTTTVIDPTASAPGITVSASGTTPNPLTIQDLKVTGVTGTGNTGSGIAILSGSHININHVESSGNGGNGLGINTATTAVDDLTLDHVDFNSNGQSGFRIPTSMTGMDGLTISDSHFDNNTFSGMEINGPPSTGAVTNVSITDSTFSGDGNKGIYAERLDNATLDGITVNLSGTSGGFAAGIDINLKKQAFTDITIQDSTITNSGTGDATNGVGITIKARDDGTNGPTSLVGVTLTGNTITGNQTGIRIGEATKSNAGPTGVQINRNNISGSVSDVGLINTSVAGGDAECNWWGDSSGPGDPGGGRDDVTAESGKPLYDFTPWLTSSALDGACAEPQISLTPASHGYGNQLVGTTSAPFTFTVENVGTANLTITNVSLAGTNPGHFGIDTNNCLAQVLAYNATCTILVDFGPSSLGAKSAQLVVDSSDPGNPSVDSDLSGTGTSTPPTGSIKITLDARPNSARNFAFSGDLGPFSLDNDSNATLPRQRTFSGLAVGDYTITQVSVSRWALIDLSCNGAETIDEANRTVTIHLSAGENAICSFTDAKRQPDAKIAKSSGGSYAGSNVYSSTVVSSQTKNRAIALGQTKSFFVLVQNDSLNADSFLVDGSLSGSSKFKVTFFRGATDITAAVLAGTYSINNLASGAQVTIEMRVKAKLSTPASATRNIDVLVTSSSAPAARDIVRGHVTRA